MAHDLDSARIANATTEPEQHEGIEVTNDMVKAGVLRLFDYDPCFANEEDVVIEIFLAMFRTSQAMVSRSHLCSSDPATSKPYAP
jgi:hypothetical protein